ncbi:hypothetical protein LXL04_017856 [Taraxacum kok-saghyz]
MDSNRKNAPKAPIDQKIHSSILDPQERGGLDFIQHLIRDNSGRSALNTCASGVSFQSTRVFTNAEVSLEASDEDENGKSLKGSQISIENGSKMLLRLPPKKLGTIDIFFTSIGFKMKGGDNDIVFECSCDSYLTMKLWMRLVFISDRRDLKESSRGFCHFPGSKYDLKELVEFVSFQGLSGMIFLFWGYICKYGRCCLMGSLSDDRVWAILFLEPAVESTEATPPYFRRRPEFETSLRGSSKPIGVSRRTSPHKGLNAKDLSEHAKFTRHLHTPCGLSNPYITHAQRFEPWTSHRETRAFTIWTND